MKIKSIAIYIGILCAVFKGNAWNSVADFECAATNALEHIPTLLSVEFGDELTNYIAMTSDHESRVAALIVSGERLLANYNETMDSRQLSEAFSVASNVCALTGVETNAWYCWQAKLFAFTCHAQNDEMAIAYSVASNAFEEVGLSNVTTSNIISTALLKRNQAEGLSIRQAVVLAKALSAAMLKKDGEATNLAALLPMKYQDMVMRALNSD